MRPSEGTEKCQGNVSALGNAAGDSVHRAEGRSTTRREEAGRAPGAPKRRTSSSRGDASGGRARRRPSVAAKGGKSSASRRVVGVRKSRGGVARAKTRGRTTRAESDARDMRARGWNASVGEHVGVRARVRERVLARSSERVLALLPRLSRKSNDGRSDAESATRQRIEHAWSSNRAPNTTRYWYSYEREKRGVKISEGRRAPRPRDDRDDRLMARCI